jgi:hypothetical protein
MTKQSIFATAVAVFAATSFVTAAQAADIKCSGANACKGQNACKGKGFTEAKDAATCTAAGGKAS